MERLRQRLGADADQLDLLAIVFNLVKGHPLAEGGRPRARLRLGIDVLELVQAVLVGGAR